MSWNTIVFASSKLGTRHTLTGVWVEIFKHIEGRPTLGSHPHGCVSWNLFGDSSTYGKPVTPSRVCELKFKPYISGDNILAVTPSRVCELKWQCRKKYIQICTVTPSRVCELKSGYRQQVSSPYASHPHGCVSWNDVLQLLISYKISHTLTGVWVEIYIFIFYWIFLPSHPHGCVSWNAFLQTHTALPPCHTLTGVWVEIHWGNKWFNSD